MPISSHISEVNRSALAPTVLELLTDTEADVDMLATGRIVRFALMLDDNAPGIVVEPAVSLRACNETVAEVASVAEKVLTLLTAPRTAPSVDSEALVFMILPPGTLTDACEARVAEAVITPVT